MGNKVLRLHDQALCVVQDDGEMRHDAPADDRLIAHDENVETVEVHPCNADAARIYGGPHQRAIAKLADHVIGSDTSGLQPQGQDRLATEPRVNKGFQLMNRPDDADLYRKVGKPR